MRETGSLRLLPLSRESRSPRYDTSVREPLRPNGRRASSSQARSLQIGKAVPVIAVTSVAANLFTIAAGPPMLASSLGIVVRLLAFALVISAAALTPAPVRAAEPDSA
jgi:hypothetical protein